MGQSTGRPQAPVSARIKVLRVDAEPASVLIELEGKDLSSQPASCSAMFDARHLLEQLFPTLFTTSLDAVLKQLGDRVGRYVDQPLALADLQWASKIAPGPLTFDQVHAIAKVNKELEQQTLTFLLQAVRSTASEIAGKPCEPAAPEPAKSEGGSPPRDDGSLLADGVSNSSVAAGGVDTPLPLDWAAQA